MINSFGNETTVMELVSRCGSISWLKVGSVKTAEWASARCGENEHFEYFETKSKDGTSISEHLTKREALLPAEFLHLKGYQDGDVSGIHIFKMSRAFTKAPHITNIQPDWT